MLSEPINIKPVVHTQVEKVTKDYLWFRYDES